MEYVPPKPVEPSKVPMRPVHLPNVPVIKAAPVPKLHAKPVKVEKAGPAPKTRPCYGMAQPYKAGIHGVPLEYVAQ